MRRKTFRRRARIKRMKGTDITEHTTTIGKTIGSLYKQWE